MWTRLKPLLSRQPSMDSSPQQIKAVSCLLSRLTMPVSPLVCRVPILEWWLSDSVVIVGTHCVFFVGRSVGRSVGCLLPSYPLSQYSVPLFVVSVCRRTSLRWCAPLAVLFINHRCRWISGCLFGAPTPVPCRSRWSVLHGVCFQISFCCVYICMFNVFRIYFVLLHS